MLYEIIKPGIFHVKGLPVFGKQHLGITPGGAMDRFAFESGAIMLGLACPENAFEVIYPPVIRINTDLYFVLTGAPCTGTYIERGDTRIPVNHARVYHAQKEDLLHVGKRIKGFRTYISFRRGAVTEYSSLLSRARDDSTDIFGWYDSGGKIRVLEGPEYDLLDDENLFFNNSWLISDDSDSMGLRISSGGVMLSVSRAEMISEPVADGIIQLTPSGPIILMRERQTVGGYPRIFCCIGPDVDILAQYSPGQVIIFKKVTISEALAVSRQRHDALNNLRKKFPEV